jgi:(p)ppGpp synthase/HD superfamily hydrolase
MKDYSQYQLSERLAKSAYTSDGLQHVYEVATKCESFKLKTIAILHDIIEDTLITISVLQHYDFDDDIIQAVSAITRLKSETYFQYIKRLNHNHLATQVKLIDLQVNIRRCEQNPKGALLVRYYTALKMLK